MTDESKETVAVIGGGVAGIVASYLLQRKYDVTLYEKNDYPGGHTNTIVIDTGPDAGTPVDTGFIVLNDRTYPLFNTFLKELQVPIDKTDMSFSFTDRESGFYYGSSNVNALFADRRNLLRGSFWRLLVAIVRFNRLTARRLEAGSLSVCSLGEYLISEGFDKGLIDNYLIPMSAAIWSTPDAKMMDFPAESFARFLSNHGLLTVAGHPQWYVVRGGSHSYVKAWRDTFRGTVLLNEGVLQVRRKKSKVVLSLGDGREADYDYVVIAAHADEALAMLADPSADERRLLSPWHYAKNRTVLHRDTSFMPPGRRAWASWNYVRVGEAGTDAPVAVTYHMNRLQNLTTDTQYLVTLNPVSPIQEKDIICEIIYDHPLFDFDALATQPDLQRLNGRRRTYFCGSYHGYGFHEDAVRSAVQVAGKFGITL